jgi:hypothetical protein
MRVSLASLQTLQKSNVVEIKFMRRNFKPGSPPTRRMLCTGDLSLLNSPQGRVALNFRPAYNKPAYNPTPKNLIVTWDIFMQDYRMINMDACEMITVVPNANFWKFFNEKLALMSAAQKVIFMNT